MTITASDLSTEDLHRAVDHFVKRIAEVIAEAEETKKQLARVQQHVAVVDAVNQAQASEINDLKLELHRRDAAYARLAAHSSGQQELIDRLQRQDAPESRRKRRKRGRP